MPGTQLRIARAAPTHLHDSPAAQFWRSSLERPLPRQPCAKPISSPELRLPSPVPAHIGCVLADAQWASSRFSAFDAGETGRDHPRRPPVPRIGRRRRQSLVSPAGNLSGGAAVAERAARSAAPACPFLPAPRTPSAHNSGLQFLLRDSGRRARRPSSRRRQPVPTWRRPRYRCAHTSWPTSQFRGCRAKEADEEAQPDRSWRGRVRCNGPSSYR